MPKKNKTKRNSGKKPLRKNKKNQNTQKQKKNRAPRVTTKYIQRPKVSLKKVVSYGKAAKSPMLSKATHETLHEAIHSNLGNQIDGKHTVDSLLSNTDKMYLAKLSPGTFNTPYVASMNTIPIAGLNFKVAKSYVRSYVESIGFEPTGSRDHVIMTYCPALSATQNSDSTGRLSGWTNTQVTNSTNNALHAEWYNNTNTYSKTMKTFYGSDASGFASMPFVWAGQLDIALAMPIANVNGFIYRGQIQFRQLFDTVGNPIFMTVDDLIEIAHTVTRITIDDPIQISLKSGVVNHDLLFDAPKQYDWKDPTDFGAEIIDYVIVQRGAASITDDTLLDYSIAASAKCNMAFFPQAQDPIVNNLFRATNFESFKVDKISHFTDPLKSIAHEPQARMTPKLVQSIDTVARNVGSDGHIKTDKADSLGEVIMNGISSVADQLPEIADKVALAAKIAPMLASTEEEVLKPMMSKSDAYKESKILEMYLLQHYESPWLRDIVEKFKMKNTEYQNWISTQPDFIPLYQEKEEEAPDVNPLTVSSFRTSVV